MLYNKYRPRQFNEVVGQYSTVTGIENGLRKGNVSHAYLLSGPRGTGKTTVARLIAAHLNCIRGSGCGHCAPCENIVWGSCADVHEVNAASTRGIDAIRDLKDSTAFKPMLYKYKVYIIDEVHMLTTEASNAILKVLEEPPENVVFILATTEIIKVLPTITSRCQVHRFKLVPLREIFNVVSRVCVDEGINIDQGTATVIAESSHGSVRDALSTLDLIQNLQDKSVENVRLVLDKPSYHDIQRWVYYIAYGNGAGAIRYYNELLEKHSQDVLIKELFDWFKVLLVSSHPQRLRPHPAIDLIYEQVDDFSVEDVKVCLKHIADRRQYPGDEGLGVELMLLDMCDNISEKEDF